jgi:hypothetical protein
VTDFNKTILHTATITVLAMASAQAVFGSLAGKGLKLGLTRAAMTGPGADPGLLPQTGLTAGGFVTLGLTRNLSIQPEVLYTSKGAETESGVMPYEYQFAYVEIPVLCRLAFADQGAAFRPGIYAGPFVGIKVDARKETYRDRDQEESDEENLLSARQIDAGYTVGVGADQILGPGRVLLDVRYAGSLLSAFTSGAKVRHSVTSVFFGYSFD